MTTEISDNEDWGDIVLKYLKERYNQTGMDDYNVIHNEVAPFVYRLRQEVILPHASKSEKYNYMRWDDIENSIILHKATMQAIQQLDGIIKGLSDYIEKGHTRDGQIYIATLNKVVNDLKKRLQDF